MAQLTPTRIDTPTRLSAVVCLLVLVWIVTYWLWEPRRVGELPVTFAPARGAAPVEPAPPSLELNAPAPRLPVTDPLAPPPQPRVEAPRFAEYVVQDGDTIDAVAERYYNTREHAAAILQANPFVDPTKLIPGRTRLRIPLDPGNVQGRVVAADPAASDPANPATDPTAPVNPAASPSAASRTVEYTITREDTLWDIAEAYYGQGHLWRKIYEANRDVISNPDRPPVGKTIRIPPLE